LEGLFEESIYWWRRIFTRRPNSEGIKGFGLALKGVTAEVRYIDETRKKDDRAERRESKQPKPRLEMSFKYHPKVYIWILTVVAQTLIL
jgi:hypothetical protein